MKKIFFATLLIFAAFAITACACETAETPEPAPPEIETETPTPEPEPEPEPEAPARPSGAMTDISSADFVRSIGPGWNLGNQFDAHQYGGLGFSWLGGGLYEDTSVLLLETAWVGGFQSAVTREFIQTLNDAGFTGIRIPVTWNKVAPGPDYIIREDWMERVYEVVGWAYEADMHIILNTHHENGFNLHDDIHGICLLDENVEHSIFILTTWWRQIATQFEPFGERLIFAGLNEPRTRENEWNGGVDETRINLNRLNQAFVDTVRATGGNNESRFLLVPTHAASAANQAFNGFEIPTDSANDRIIMAIHTYSPFAWAHDGRGEYGGDDEIRPALERVAGHAERLGVSVILSEWGSINNGEEGNLEQREQHAYDYVRIARELGMATFWWDNNQGGAGTHGFGLFNRATNEIIFPTIIDAIIRAYE